MDRALFEIKVYNRRQNYIKERIAQELQLDTVFLEWFPIK